MSIILSTSDNTEPFPQLPPTSPSSCRSESRTYDNFSQYTHSPTISSMHIKKKLKKLLEKNIIKLQQIKIYQI